MKELQEPKYQAVIFHDGEPSFGDDTKVINRITGEAIPDDEPIMIFRARDVHALDVIAHYRRLCSDEGHKRVVNDRWHDFNRFAEAHPDRMKEPDS